MSSQSRLRLISTVRDNLDIPQTIALSDQDVTVFGRSRAHCNVVLESKLIQNMISRQHAKIIADANREQFTMIDLGSKNGVFVNDRKIDAVQLKDGDIVVFGGGCNSKLGDYLPQPNSEFRYKFEIIESENPRAKRSDDDDEEEEEEGAFETMKTITDNINVIITWITSLVLAGTYLFAEEDSEELSYVRDLLVPIFGFLGIPFNRTTFLLLFVIGFTAMVGAPSPHLYYLFDESIAPPPSSTSLPHTDIIANSSYQMYRDVNLRSRLIRSHSLWDVIVHSTYIWMDVMARIMDASVTIVLLWILMATRSPHPSLQPDIPIPLRPPRHVPLPPPFIRLFAWVPRSILVCLLIPRIWHLLKAGVMLVATNRWIRKTRKKSRTKKKLKRA